MIVLILSMNFLVSTNSFSQEIQWQNTIGGDSTDELRSIGRTLDGGFILGGTSVSTSSGDKSINSIREDYWVVKTDSLGVVQWDKTIRAYEKDYLYSVSQTTDGKYILGGYSYSDSGANKSEDAIPMQGSNNNSKDYWIVKINAAGNVNWDNTIGGNSDDLLISIQQTTDGGYILGGKSKSLSSYDKTENYIGPVGYFDYWIVKVNSTGIIQWQNTIGGSSSDELTSIRQTTDGGYILGGFSSSNISGDKTENCIGGWDYWIVKVDSLGVVQWQNTIGGNGNEQLNDVQLTFDGGYVLGGWSESNISGDKTENSKGDRDFWIVKVDSLGVIQWENTIGGYYYDELNALQQTPDGGYLLGGYSNSIISGDKIEDSRNFLGGYGDYWIVKIDSLGMIQWQKSFGGDGYDYLTSIQLTSDEGCILGGYSYSNISKDKTENPYGSCDFWVLKLTSNYNLITGKIYADINSNGIQDIGETALANKKVTETSTGRFAFSNQQGDYSVAVLDTGNYNVSTQPITWYNTLPVIHSATFSGLHQKDSLKDFAFQPIGSYEDVCVDITPMGAFRSGFSANYLISYSNNGTTTVAPSVYFFPSGNITYQSASIVPVQITPDSVIWNLPALLPFQTGSFIVTVQINLGLSMGTLINSSVHIEPYITDVNPSCNNSNWEVRTTGSYDPNDILVSEFSFTTTQISNSPWLDYYIRFQNTGNDTAFTVKILNPIDTNKLDISSIEFVNASHPVNINWSKLQNSMEFKFENILLPDSITNEALSHGLLHYRIRSQSTLNAGDTIKNFAFIYFDFNDPVITNTAKTIIVLPTGLPGTIPSPGKLLVFPNPAENSISISGIQLENGKAQLRLMDIYGKLILEKTIAETTANLETDQLAKGVYLIQSGGSRATFVKQ
ncbi:MAG: T9SS type A sorting domain-containing protein [Bacteroidia bacterium]|nr:T9SS type A sorting domain-containing protein [Bacteroidia bacterium]